MYITSSVILIFLVGVSTAKECPPAESIAPCSCSTYTGLSMSCYELSTEEELRTIFHSPDYPDKDFMEIHITYGGFESLGADLFGELTTDILHINNNKNLKSLDANLLRGSMSQVVRVIDIVENPLLQEADLRLLEILTRKDIMLEMRGNGATTIIPPSVPSNVFSLNLGQNNFAEIKADMLKNLVGLKYLYIYESGISSIQAGTFASLTEMTDLQLHDNNLGPVLKAGSFELPASLDSLTLDRNIIENLEPEALSGFSPSAYLSLWTNKLNSFTEDSYRPILETLAQGGGLISLYYNFDLPCDDCSMVWIFLTPGFLETLDQYYCDPYTQITDIDADALIARCT